MTFRSKLLASIVAVVATTTVATLFIAQAQNTASYQAVLDELFRSEVSSFRARQELQLAATTEQAAKLAESVRLFAALEESDSEIYKIAGDELRVAGFAFFRLTDASGKIIPPPQAPPDGKACVLDGTIDAEISAVLTKAEMPRDKSALGFVSVRDEHGRDQVFSVVSSPITNFGKTVGSLLVGQAVSTETSLTQVGKTELISVLYLNGKFHSDVPSLATEANVESELMQTINPPTGNSHTWVQQVGGHIFRADSHLLNAGSAFAPAFIVSLYPLDDLQQRQRELIWRVAGIGGLGLLAAAGVGSVFAQRLARPVRDLVSGTAEIKLGNYDVRVRRSTEDELGTLADAFNEMAAGLALKEKYRSVLQLVTDRSVAEELMSGAVQLGGEVRDVSVIFCDIRGFTSISQGMKPADVVAMLNEHMSALTHIVHRHHGVVDKFVGDSIMTLFGAPKSYGQDAISAVRCAWEMIRERERMNAGSVQPLRIGIGIATGPVLAGCMGSDKRLNYTVIGERVNLAARLCSHARPMEIVIDEATRAALPPGFDAGSMGELLLKGFSDPVPAYHVNSVSS